MFEEAEAFKIRSEKIDFIGNLFYSSRNITHNVNRNKNKIETSQTFLDQGP